MCVAFCEFFIVCENADHVWGLTLRFSNSQTWFSTGFIMNFIITKCTMRESFCSISFRIDIWHVKKKRSPKLMGFRRASFTWYVRWKMLFYIEFHVPIFALCLFLHLMSVKYHRKMHISALKIRSPNGFSVWHINEKLILKIRRNSTILGCIIKKNQQQRRRRRRW